MVVALPSEQEPAPWQVRRSDLAGGGMEGTGAQGGSDVAKVMVVDDAVFDTKLMESILRAAGHQVICYGNGEGLEEKVETEQPDVLLLDVVMPRRNGYEVLRSLKKSVVTKSTPVVLVSSKNQSSDEAWGRRQGADDYIGKPFTPEQLVSVVRRFVA
jgi:CheY-like chemotaxis protein